MTTPPWGESPGSGNPDQPAQPYAAPPPPAQGYQPYGGPAAPYGVPYRTQSTNGLAIASLVVSIVSMTLLCGMTGVVGAILGHVSRKQIKERGDAGDGMALAGIIIGWIGFAIFLCVVLFYVGVFALVFAADSSSGY